MTDGDEGKKVIKVTPSQVAAARARVIVDTRWGWHTPDWIKRVARLSPRNPTA